MATGRGAPRSGRGWRRVLNRLGRRPDTPSVGNPRLVAAVTFALVAACAGALAVGLEEPVIGAVAAIAGVAAAATASLGMAPSHTAQVRPRSPATEPPDGTPADAPVVAVEAPPADLERRRVRTGAAEDGDDLVDDLTGMLDHRYFLVALERRVTASRRKLAPFSLVVLELWPVDPKRDRVSDQSIKVLAAVVRAVLRESDTGCRIDDHTIALLLEDTPEAGAVWATERVRGGFFATTFRGNVSLAVGIASYPAHALEPERLLRAARDAAARSREAGDQAIEIASADESAEGTDA